MGLPRWYRGQGRLASGTVLQEIIPMILGGVLRTGS